MEADMTTDIKATINTLFDEVINQGHLETIDDVFDPDFVDHGPGPDLHGRDAFKGAVAAWRGAMSGLRCEVSHLVVEGETAAWLVHTTGTHTGDTLGFPATGRHIDTVSANLAVFRDGKVVEHWAEQGMLATLQQLGVIPAMAPQPVS
jgi:predicted ester cyclase